MTDRTLDYIVNHVFLPPRVPQANDYGNGLGDRALIDLVVRSAQAFRDLNDTKHYQQWSSIHRALRTFATVHQHSNSLSKNTLSNALQDIQDGGIAIFHIAVQNSALVIRKNAEHYLIESFEVSPPAAVVLATSGALQRDFPSKAVAIAATTFEDPSFQAAFTDFLERASVEPVKQFAAVAFKAGSFAYESRDTAIPAVIGQLLMSLLEANGHKHMPTLTRKRMHDDVQWNVGAENPWRRSPAWLVLRVGLQRCLCFILGASIGTLHYKFFMCFIMSTICRKLCTGTSDTSDQLAFARSKLARRLAKLQHHKDLTTPQTTKAIESMFARFEKEFRGSLKLAGDELQNTWSLIQIRTTRRIPALPKRADQSSTILSLAHSRPFLLRVLGEVLYNRPPVHLNLGQWTRDVGYYYEAREAQQALSAVDYLHLADFELDLKLTIANYTNCELQESPSNACMLLNRKLESYQNAAVPAYQSNPEQNSLMLLTIMDLWRLLDSLALQVMPLLARYDAGFPSNLLHCLQLSQSQDLQRLRKVEQYLKDRQSMVDNSLPSIFGEITRHSFSVQYFDDCDIMQRLRTRIENANEDAKVRKEEEWMRESARYEEIIKDAASTACLYIEDNLNPLFRQHDDRGCRKHYLERKARRMRISTHEAMLPDDAVAAKAVVFELLLPQSFAAWRDATWRILQLARQHTLPDRAPQMLLRDYPALGAYMKSAACNVLLASRTKSFQNTHYSQVSFPTSLDKVCLNHGLKYGLYDHAGGFWTLRHSAPPDFADLCASSMPPSSTYASLKKFLHPNFEGNHISSNEVIANQTRCPTTLNIAEYTSFQDLRLGNRIQWITLLRELASPNLNFGTTEVGTLVAQLALTTGPSEEHSHLRSNHWVFQDQGFCSALAAQIKKRLEGIASNWREGQTVECMMTLIERIWSLATSIESVKQAEALLLDVRKMTYEWTQSLRVEICNATDIESAQKRSQNALLAAILARRTFVIEASKSNDLIRPDALTCFLECAFSLKDNLSKNEAKNVSKMSVFLRKLFVADLKLVHQLEDQLRRTIEASPEAVNQAVSNVWADSRGDSARVYTKWKFLAHPHSKWLAANAVGGDMYLEQSLHIDIFDGALLIGGQPLGRLPEDYTRQEFFQQLFGTRIFLTYPSNIPGMSYSLAALFHGHEVHFGFRGVDAFVRARIKGRILEWIPSTVFHHPQMAGGPPDLPLPLIHDCVHWLDIGSQVLEVRPFASMWQAKFSNWKIDLRTSVARRRERSLLVDPRSSTFRLLTNQIEPFENRANMTVFQPERANLSIHLPKLELYFRVNRDGFLESQQLRAAIDPNQDAGTFYGLQSSIVLRDCVMPEDRSIIVAMGPAVISSDPDSKHVRVQTNHTGYYARFYINKELGRVECAAEPRLIYFKAYCHAVTSFLLPDPLTGRTGTDEALHSLQAGNAQPWAPVDQESYRILYSIAELTPQRQYYPEKLKALQKVKGSDTLMPAIQHEQFRSIVESIIQQCKVLCQFHLGSNKPQPSNRTSDDHLGLRAMARNQAYRAGQHKTENSTGSVEVYTARDCGKPRRCQNVFEVASLVKRWSGRLDVCNDLAAILREWPTIQGYDHTFEHYLFADLINIDLASCWGSLVRLCLGASEVDRFKFMFLFATIAFDAEANMTLVRSLIAMAVMDRFKDIQLPQSSEFRHFQGVQIPTVDFLMQLTKPFRLPYPGDERSLISVPMHPKQRRKLETAELRHEEQSEQSCKVYASRLLSQWPSRNLSSTLIEPLPLFDSAKAVLVVQPEWERLFDNFQLSEHLSSVQKILNTCQVDSVLPLPVEMNPGQEFYPTMTAANVQPTLQSLLHAPDVQGRLREDDSGYLLGADPGALQSSVKSPQNPLQPPHIANRSHLISSDTAPALLSELKGIVLPFSSSQDFVRRVYGQDLQKSISALERLQIKSPSRQQHEHQVFDPRNLDESILFSRRTVQTMFDSIRRSLIHQAEWLELGGLLPDITSITLLETLALSTKDDYASTVILGYAQSITHLQHLLRIQSACLRADTIQLANEIRHDDHPNWRAKEHTDWVLLQIDFNFLIRQDQYEVAQAMIKPSSGTNSVLQMNMGQGKSSVIIPMIVAELANGKDLTRVVVPRPLLLQAAQLLQSRLGGLMGRTVMHIPFSRKSSTELANLRTYHGLHASTLRDRGVILTLPEHLLSFQLSGLQELSNGHLQQADSMMKLQNWFGRKCRDILDESDHMLAVKTQLIYPSGSQSMVDGHPIRWTVTQDLLKLVNTHLRQLRIQFPRGVEVIERGPGAFPTVYLLNQEVKDTLMSRVTDSVINGEGNVLPISDCPQDVLALISRFLRDATNPKAIASKVAAVFKDKVDMRQRLLLLRGLLVHRILLMGLSKRWNVQYGIDSRRDPIAVPYRSKGIPSDQAEFGHPDVSILLTCLSFYYSGLTPFQFRQALTHLMKSDEPAREFESWVQGVRAFPDSLRSWNAINSEDEAQCTHIWNFLSRQMTVINFFLNHAVFPRHARTFERKLVSSGWDIATRTSQPDVISQSELKENVCRNENSVSSKRSSLKRTSLTVGFSGTNDNKTLLPMNIVQDDLPGLTHTNAEVLTYLLQPRNKRYYPAVDRQGKRLTEKDFLHKLRDHGIRMLLDAGALIIELDNISLVQLWLEVDNEAEAAVFFGLDGRARVLYRDGKQQPLAGSPFMNHLESCVVYLDEVRSS